MEDRYHITRVEENRIDIFSLLDDILKRFRETWWVYILILLIGASAGFIKEKRTYRELYEASASFVVSAGDQSNIASSNYYNKVSAEQMKATFPYILTSGALNRVVANDLGLASVPGSISAQKLGDTNLFQVKVTASSGQMAYDILQSVVENYPQVARYIIGDTQLKLLDESGVPEQPVNAPRYMRSILKGLFAGMVLCAIILLIRVMARSTVKNSEDLKKFLNVKYLCGIPQARFKRRSSRRTQEVLVDNPVIPDAYSEAMDTLQVRLIREMKERHMKTLMVTSALAGEGKTTTACNIAILLAKKGYKVTLIDGDLRNPSVIRTLGIDGKERGLCDVLAGTESAENIICRYEEELNLYILPGGKPIQKVERMYTNGTMEELITDYAKTMDFVVVDTPPCAIMNDAALIAPNVEAGLMVIRQDYARKDKILTGAEMIAQSGTVLVGCVINGETTGIGSYGYGRYGYGRYRYGRYGYGKYGYGEPVKLPEQDQIKK